MPWSQSRDETDGREAVFNAPLVAVLLAASMPLMFLVQRQLPDFGLGLAFRPASLFDGGWWPGVVTDLFIHGGWSHVAMNAALALAFGTPVARLLGPRRGVFAFLAFYMACGVAASVGYALIHPTSQDMLLGASGAVFGLLGAALRLLGRRTGTLRPLTDRRVLVTSAILMVLNAALGLIGFAPGMEGARVAWEAHAVGFVLGILLIGPLAKVVRRESFDSSPDLSDPPI
jgi:membrane associated rhomboid family serine protease